MDKAEMYDRVSHALGAQERIRVSMTQKMTPEQKAQADAEEAERVQKREAEQAAKREAARLALESLPARPGNDPHASQLNPWGNRFIGRILPNEEARMGSLILPNQRATQDLPHACEVIRVSEHLDRSLWPKLAQASDRIAAGEPTRLVVLFPCSAGTRWTDTRDGFEYVDLDPKFVTGDYSPDAVRRGE